MNLIDLSTVAPAPIQGHTSKGDQPKWEVGGVWYKADHMGYEALAEVVISHLLEKSNVPDFVLYDVVNIQYDAQTRVGCASRNFRVKSEELIPFERLHRAYHGQGLAQTLARMPEAAEQIRYTVEFVESVTGLDGVGAYLTRLLELDGLFLNEDRHTNNLAVIRNQATGVFRLCPVFDNGLSLLSDLNDYPLDEDVFECISRVQAKPFHRDFDEQISAAEQLYGLQLRLSFDRHDVSDMLAALTGIYDDAILRRVETVLREQMRKYPIYFRAQ